MARAHCSDDQLIAFLDGELPESERRLVARHLDVCWHCRPRAAELEEQIGRLRRLFADTDPAVDDWSPGCRNRLLERCRSLQMETPRRESDATRKSFRRAFWALAASGALAFASITTWISVHRTEPFRTLEPPPQSQRIRPEAAPLPEASVPRTSPVPAPVSVKPQPDLEVLEVEARFVLHRLGWDIEDPPDIRQEGGAVVLRGIWTMEQLDLLREALSGLGQPELARLESKIGEAQAGEITTYSAPPSNSPPGRPFEEELLARAGSRAKLVSAGNAAVALSERIMDLAWALRRLEARYTPAVRNKLAPHALGMLSKIESDYLTALREEAGRLNAGMRLFAQPPDTTPPAEGLFESAHAARDLLQWLFAGRSLAMPPATLAEAEVALWRHLAGLEARVNSRLASLQP